MSKNVPQNESKPQAEQQVDSRREAIKKIGKYAAFTAPVLLGMVSRPARAS